MAICSYRQNKATYDNVIGLCSINMVNNFCGFLVMSNRNILLSTHRAKASSCHVNYINYSLKYP